MANIKDVAKKAGTSIATVSKVFNGYSEIPAATREKVFEAAKELDYVPSKSAVELSSKNPKHYIGLVLNSISFQYATDEYKFKLLCGISNKVEQLDFELLIFTTKQIEKFNNSYLNFFRYHNLYGAIIHGFDTDEAKLDNIVATNFPCVFIDRFVNDDKYVSVTIDTYKACEDVFEVLKANNHKNICQILGSADAEVAILRRDCFNEVAKKNNYNLNNLHYFHGNFNEQLSYTKTLEFLQEHPETTAIFAHSDTMALGAYKAINELGYKIGENFTLIGFDGLTTLNYTTPAISTVNQNFEIMGELAVEKIVDIANDRNVLPVNFNKHQFLLKGSVHNVQ